MIRHHPPDPCTSNLRNGCNDEKTTHTLLLMLVIDSGFSTLIIQAQTKPPNIVFIQTDDQAAWALGISGNRQAYTPNLDRLFRGRGRDIVPLLKGKRVKWDDDLYVEYSQHHYTWRPSCKRGGAQLSAGNSPGYAGVLACWLCATRLSF